MIFDKIENADLYFDSVPGLEQFVRFYNDNDLQSFASGKVRLNADELFINIIDLDGRAENECPMESHRDYIDIQVPLTGTERMGWKPQEECQNITQEYDEEKDLELYSDQALNVITVPVGYFVVFFPTDGHQPGIGEGRTWRKLIVKTKVQG